MEREYLTTDLYIAAYLVTTGLPLLRIDGPERRKWFVFPSEAEEEARLKSLRQAKKERREQ